MASVNIPAKYCRMEYFSTTIRLLTIFSLLPCSYSHVYCSPIRHPPNTVFPSTLPIMRKPSPTTIQIMPSIPSTIRPLPNNPYCCRVPIPVKSCLPRTNGLRPPIACCWGVIPSLILPPIARRAKSWTDGKPGDDAWPATIFVC